MTPRGSPEPETALHRSTSADRRPLAIDCRGLGVPDLGTIDALACLALSIRRRGGRIWLRNADPALCELIELAGIAAVLPTELNPRASARPGSR